jgi:hypothetical protein
VLHCDDFDDPESERYDLAGMPEDISDAPSVRCIHAGEVSLNFHALECADPASAK